MIIAETERLIIQEIVPEDAPFILELLNTPSWIAFIGDRGIRTEDSARIFINDRLRKSYVDLGFGFYLTKLRSDGIPIGICGLVKRESLENIDLGFAFLPEHEGKGYGYESSLAILNHAKFTLKINKIAAITNKENERSINLLKKLGLSFDKMVLMPGETKEIMLFGKEL